MTERDLPAGIMVKLPMPKQPMVKQPSPDLVDTARPQLVATGAAGRHE